MTKILFHAPAMWGHSGYSNAVRYFLPEIQAAGYDVAIQTYIGLDGAVIEYGGITHFPQGKEMYSQEVVPVAAKRFGAKHVISVADSFVLQHIGEKLAADGVRWSPWCPIDHERIPSFVLQALRTATDVLPYSAFGQRECEREGLVSTHMPLGAPVSIFYPRNKAEARSAVAGVPNDAFVYGMVAGNYDIHDRKNFGSVIPAFRKIVDRHPDARLYLHTNFDTRHGGLNLGNLVRHYELEHHVHFPAPYRYSLGYSDEEMAHLYSAFDVLLCPSTGEGFGVPLIEAQMCGVPVVIGDWTSMPELFSGAGHVIPRHEAETWFTYQSANQFRPTIAAVERAMERMYNHRPAAWTDRAIEFARMWDVPTLVRDYWLPYLERVEDEGPPPPANGEVPVDMVPVEALGKPGIGAVAA